MIYKYSILLATNKSDRYLSLALKSIIIQMTFKGELIIVVNGNIESYEIDNIIKNILIENSITKIDYKIVNSSAFGLNSALCVGLNVCRGEYIIRMDADDISCPQRIKYQTEFLDSNPNVNVIGSRAIVIDEFGNEIGKTIGIVLPTKHVNLYLKSHCPLIHPSVAFRRAAINSVGGYGLHYFAEDYDLWARVERRYPNTICVIDPPLIFYRVHGEQITFAVKRFEWELYRKFIQIRELFYGITCSAILLLFIPRKLVELFIKIVIRYE